MLEIFCLIFLIAVGIVVYFIFEKNEELAGIKNIKWIFLAISAASVIVLIFNIISHIKG